MKGRLPESLRSLAGVFRAHVEPWRLRACASWFVFVVTAALLVARQGTARSRALTIGLLVLSVLPAIVLRGFDFYVFRRPARAIRHLVGPAFRDVGDRAIRALSLLDRESEGTSRSLANLHVERSLAALPAEHVRARAGRFATVFGVLTAALVVGTFALSATNLWGMFEGMDVLLARGGKAPFSADWLEDLELRARPPDYLHQDERSLFAYDEAFLPRGSLVTVRGRPLHAGRRLFLTDGTVEIPFVEDGTGQVVARWPLAESAQLRVSARFGDVVVEEPRATFIESVADRAPEVVLEGAPKRILLGESDTSTGGDTTDIPIHYVASDDHGLREVHLVLRAGAREDRRVLAHLDGETTNDRGGHLLRATDPFIKKSHAPVEIRVEAKDADPVTGPKWGASEAILVVPPNVGEPEARRFEALRDVRNVFVDMLAWQMANRVPTDPVKRRAFLEEERRRYDEGREHLERALTASHAGARVSGRLPAVLRGRLRKLGDAVTNESRSPSSAAHDAVVRATERMTLVVDAVLQGLALRDARSTAKELADVADDLSLAATLAQKPAERARAEQRMDASVLVLEGGGRSLLRLASLGRDLGGIVAMDLRRIARARTVDGAGSSPDFVHAGLAAQDLAARLRQPDPSFGASGGRPAQAGGESGGGQGTMSSDEGGEGDDVEQAFNEAAQELERLAAEHAGQIGKVEQSIARGLTDDDRRALAEEGRKHAENVREAVRPLPSIGGGSDTWSSKGSIAREHAEQMARALEDGNVADAVQSGRNAASALEEARRAAEREARFGDRGAARTTEQAQKRLESELAWADKQLERVRKRAAESAGAELREHGDAERKLAERVGELTRRGRQQEAMPTPALDALQEAERAAREAAQALEQGQADRGLDRQREAQQHLEAAENALGEGDGEHGDGAADGRPSEGRADIPKAEDHKGPEELRRRILKGLGQPAGPGLKGAVKRYAEGLLR